MTPNPSPTPEPSRPRQFPRMPMPSLGDAQRALTAAAPSITSVPHSIEADILALADGCQPAFNAWQREACVKLLGEKGEEIMQKVDAHDLVATLQVQGLGLKIKQKIKVNRRGQPKLSYQMLRYMPESKRLVKVGQITFTFDATRQIVSDSNENAS